MFIIDIIKAIRSITSIYMIRSGSGACTSTASESDTNSDSGSDNTVTGKI